jgi:hypothetical protein
MLQSVARIQRAWRERFACRTLHQLVRRYLAVGAIGSLFVGFGVFLLLLGLLRYLQWQFPFLDGSESWIPYLAVFLASGAGIALLLTRIRRSVGPRRRSK